MVALTWTGNLPVRARERRHLPPLDARDRGAVLPGLAGRAGLALAGRAGCGCARLVAAALPRWLRGDLGLAHARRPTWPTRCPRRGRSASSSAGGHGARPPAVGVPRWAVPAWHSPDWRPKRDSIAGSRAHLPGRRTGHRRADGGAARCRGAPGPTLTRRLRPLVRPRHGVLRRLPLELPAHAVAASALWCRGRGRSRPGADPGGGGGELAVRRAAGAANAHQTAGPA